MKYNIKGTAFSITPEIRDYVEKRLSSLEKVLPLADVDTALVDIDITFLLNEAKKYRVEFMLHSSKLPAPVRVKVTSNTAFSAVDEVVTELSRELKESKKKHTNVIRRGAARAKDFLRGMTDKLS